MTSDTDLQDQVDARDGAAYDESNHTRVAPYRSVTRAGAVSLFLGVLSVFALLFPTLLVIAAVGLVMGLVARRNLRAYPEELTGGIPTTVGILLCLLILVGGTTWHSYVYATEVPNGYERISFDDLQPEAVKAKTGTPGLPLDLDGKRVFVKGYVHPGVASMGKIRRFILVPDMGTCCFGGQPKMTDMIEVTVPEALGIRYSQRKRKLGGVLRVRDRVTSVAGGLYGGYYELKADYVQ
jgi:hypothetical protein